MSSDDSVYCIGDGRIVVGGKLKNYFDEFVSVGGELLFKLKERDDIIDINFFFEDVGDLYISVYEFLVLFVGDGRDESGGFFDEIKFLDERLVENRILIK